MLLLPTRRNGRKPQFTLSTFVVLAAALLPGKHKKFGLTVTHQLSAKIMGVNGKNFINVNVNRHGGLGIAIALPLISLKNENS
jgi:hypothetical protein